RSTVIAHLAYSVVGADRHHDAAPGGTRIRRRPPPSGVRGLRAAGRGSGGAPRRAGVVRPGPDPTRFDPAPSRSLHALVVGLHVLDPRLALVPVLHLVELVGEGRTLGEPDRLRAVFAARDGDAQLIPDGPDRRRGRGGGGEVLR